MFTNIPGFFPTSSFLLFIGLFHFGAIISTQTSGGGKEHFNFNLHHSDLLLRRNESDLLSVSPEELNVVIGKTKKVDFVYSGVVYEEIWLLLEQISSTDGQTTDSSLKLDPPKIRLKSNGTSQLNITGIELTSRTFVVVANCTTSNGTVIECPFNKEDVFVQVTVVKSEVISVLVIVTGWIYFVAWSISFYPQIVLNYQRKSVVGLNFDFLVLNIIGFACYTVYNVMLYFDYNVQETYHETYGQRSLIPVLFNDVVFSVHALLACIFTGFQCFIYERAAQRISYTCYCWSSALVAFSGIALACTTFGALNWLQYIEFLSYVKIAVTLSKYFPQAILNFRRKSTVGWSIGNVLLDFSGGFMDICQMCLQASNTKDWTAFYGNPVKFGLGLISMLFDIVFIIQHYFLYREKFQEISAYDQVEQIDTPNITMDGSPTSNGNSPQLRI